MCLVSCMSYWRAFQNDATCSFREDHFLAYRQKSVFHLQVNKHLILLENIKTQQYFMNIKCSPSSDGPLKLLSSVMNVKIKKKLDRRLSRSRCK